LQRNIILNIFHNLIRCGCKKLVFIEVHFPHNFPCEEFIEKLDAFDYNELKAKEKNLTTGQLYSKTNWVVQYGVADNVDQIKEFYKKQIKNKKESFVIVITPVYQDKENKGKGGGWRWHKWGEYIGVLDPQREYLDDEDFGDDFKYILCFHLYYVLP